jgi:hypothetical protein
VITLELAIAHARELQRQATQANAEPAASRRDRRRPVSRKG